MNTVFAVDEVAADPLHEFLVAVVPTLRGKDRNKGIWYFIRFFEVLSLSKEYFDISKINAIYQDLVVSTLNGSQKEWSSKDIQLMINAINFLSKELDTESLEV